MIWMCFSIGWWFPNLYLHRKCQRKWPQVDPFELNWWGFETFQVVSWLRKFYGPHTFSWLIDGSTVRVFCPNFLRFISGWRWKCFFCTTENMNMFPKTTWNHFSRNLSSSKLPTIDFQGIFVSFRGSSHCRNPRAKSHLLIRCVIRRSRRLPENTWIKVQIRQKMRDVICWVSWLVWYLI